MPRLPALSWAFLLWLPVRLNAQGTQTDFRASVAALIESSPAVSRGFAGYKVINLETGEVIAEENAQRFFVPASNTKLYTTAAALARLGQDYRFQTDLRTSDHWETGQQSVSDLQLVGGGDPNLSDRKLPYDVHAKLGDPFAVLEELADKLVGQGIREINGDVTAVSTRYPGDAYPNGWTVDDSMYGYGAPVSALVINDNVINVKLIPTKPGDPPALEMRPQGGYLTVLNEATTDGTNASQIRATRPPGTSEVVLTGSIGRHAPPWEQDFAVEDPAQFAARSLVDVLRDRGIAVRGEARVEYCPPSPQPVSSNSCESPSVRGTLLATHQSAPLGQIIQVINKVSQNLQAEMLLRELAFVTTGSGTLEAGVKAREDFLRQADIAPDIAGVALADGSGLARGDLTTPDSAVSLLSYMWKQPFRDVWVESLPLGGVDGTLEHRFHNMIAADHVHAKTGSISHVNTLSGYVETQSHGWLAFSVMVNGTTGEAKPVRDFIDRFCGLLLAY